METKSAIEQFVPDRERRCVLDEADLSDFSRVEDLSLVAEAALLGAAILDEGLDMAEVGVGAGGDME